MRYPFVHMFSTSIVISSALNGIGELSTMLLPFEWVEQPLKALLEDLFVVDEKLSVFVGVWYIDKYSNGLVPVNGSWSVSEMQVRRPIAARASHNAVLREESTLQPLNLVSPVSIRGDPGARLAACTPRP